MSENFHDDEELYVELRLWHDELIPEELTVLFGYAPSRAAKCGGHIPGRAMPVDTGLWAYKDAVEFPWDVNAAIDKLLGKFENNVPFLDYCKNNGINIEIAVVMYLKKNTPIMVLSPSVLGRLASIGATLDFGMYI
jgi:hypothetical protein